MNAAQHYWPWQKVYWYGIAAGYVRDSEEKHLGDEIIFVIDDGFFENTSEWLMELEESGAVKFRNIRLSRTNLDRYYIEHPLGAIISASEKQNIERKLLEFDFSKTYNSIAELVNNKEAGTDFLRGIYNLDVIITDIKWLESQLRSYLADFAAGNLAHPDNRTYYTYSYQKQLLVSTMKKLQLKYGKILPLASELLAGKDSVEWSFNIPELLYLLSDEHALNILTLRWTRDDDSHDLSFTFTLTRTNTATRGQILSVARMTYGDLEFDESEVFYDGETLELQPRQAALLIKLLKKQGGVATFSELIDAYYSKEIEQNDSKLNNKQGTDLQASIYTAIGSIRKLLLGYPELKLEVKTVSKTGYKILKKI